MQTFSIVKDEKLEQSRFTMSLFHMKKAKQNPVTTINHSEHRHHYIQYNIQHHVRRSISAHTT